MRKGSDVGVLVVLSMMTMTYGFAQSKALPSQIKQKSDRSVCANIVALTGNVNLNCSNLSPEQNAAIHQTQNMLRKMLAGQIDPHVIEQMNVKLDELLMKPSKGSISQNNSGGVNIQQGTTGSDSPIINSPITVGNFPKRIAPQDKASIIAFLKSAPTKAKIEVVSDQFTGGVPFPEDFFDIFQEAGWPMVGTSVAATMIFQRGKPFKGAVITMPGKPLSEGEGFTATPADPIYYVGAVLDALKIPRSIDRKEQTFESAIIIQFIGGFPEE